MNRRFSRRLVLRGLGGAAIAAPFLASVAEREAKTQGMPAPSTPKRLIVYYTYDGCLTNRWFPALSHGRLTREDYAAMRTLAPMAPYADKLLMVRGIRAMNEWSYEGTLGQKNDEYTQVCGSYFTCHPVIYHGDFTPWNIKVSPDAWHVLDWERGEMAGMPGWDWFHWMIHVSVLVHRHGTVESVAFLEAALRSADFQEYAKAARIAGLEHMLLSGYLIYLHEFIVPPEIKETIAQLRDAVAARL